MKLAEPDVNGADRLLWGEGSVPGETGASGK